MTITALQETGSSKDNFTSVSNTFGLNLTAGSLIIVMAGKEDGSAMASGDCTQTAGTATIGSFTLDKTVRIDNVAGGGGSEFATVGIWSAICSVGGSAVIRVSDGASVYWGGAIGEYASTVGWDSSRAETSNGSSDATDNDTSATTGNATSATAALFAGCIVINAPGTVTITEDAAFTKLFEQEDGTNHEPFSAIRRIVSTGTTDSADWALSGSNRGWSAALQVYREIVTAAPATYGNPIGPTALPIGPRKASRFAPFVQGNTGGAPVTVALTGQAATFTAGSMVPTNTPPLVGQSATFTPGTMVAAPSIPLAGQRQTFATGTLTPSNTPPLAGQAATFTPGTLVPSLSVALAGQPAAFTPGSMVPALSVPLIGQLANFGPGTLTSVGGDSAGGGPAPADWIVGARRRSRR